MIVQRMMQIQKKQCSLEDLRKTLAKTRRRPLSGVLTSGKSGHFAAKCPYEDNDDNNNERKSKFNKKKYRGKDNKTWKSKKSLYSKKESDEESLSDEILFMAMEEIHTKKQDVESDLGEEDVEVDLEQDSISALHEIKILKKKNMGLKVQLKEESEEKYAKSQTLEDAEKQIKDLKFQIDEAKKIEEELKNQIKVKVESCEKFEAEIASLKKIEKSTTPLNHEEINQKGSLLLENLLAS